MRPLTLSRLWRIVCTPTDVHESSSLNAPRATSERIRVYPNPSPGRALIAVASELRGDVDVLDVLGRRVALVDARTGIGTLRTPLATGLYWLRATRDPRAATRLTIQQ